MLFTEASLDIHEASTHAAVEVCPSQVLTAWRGVGPSADVEALGVLLWCGLHADGRQVDGAAQDVDHLEVAGEAVGALGLIAVDGLCQLEGGMLMLSPMDMGRAIVYPFKDIPCSLFKVHIFGYYVPKQIYSRIYLLPQEGVVNKALAPSHAAVDAGGGGGER